MSLQPRLRKIEADPRIRLELLYKHLLADSDAVREQKLRQVSDIDFLWLMKRSCQSDIEQCGMDAVTEYLRGEGWQDEYIDFFTDGDMSIETMARWHTANPQIRRTEAEE